MFWLIVAAVTTATYLLLFRQFTITMNWWLLVPIGILALISWYAYYKIFVLGRIGTSYGLVTGATVALVAIGGVLIFKEYQTIWGWLSLGLIILGVILLDITAEKIPKRESG